jgi:uncharacterized protein (TIGR02466 family)
MESDIIKIFPEIIAIYKLPHDKTEEDFLKKIDLTEVDSSLIEELGGKDCFISKNLYILEKNKLLKNKILKYINNFSDKIGLNFKLKITTSWLTKTLPNGFSRKHFHPLSFYSGVYYPFKSIKKYSIEFMKNKNDFFELSEYVKHFEYVNSKIKIDLDHNTLIIFNSALEHGVPKNNTNKERYSLAFNMMPTGLIGNLKSDSQYKF